MSKFVVIQGHPDPSEARLNRALADCYAKAALAAGHEVRYVDVARLDFPLIRRTEEFVSGEPPSAIRDAQADIEWADRIALFYPLWLGDVPALLKAFLEQTFRPGFALAAGGRNRFPKGLLGGKSGRIVVTMGMPALAYRTLFGAHSVKGLAANLRMCGIAPVETTLLGGAGDASECRRRSWFELLARLAERDGAPPPRRHRLARLALASSALAAAGYGAYVGAAWARYGRARSADASLDALMPEYDVAFYHQTRIDAAPDVAFDAMAQTSLDRSPIVQALFRAREILMRGRHSDRPLPPGLFKQFDTFGWRAIAEEPGREITFGAVTQPWVANALFRGLSRDEFVRFREPGYAKILFTLRIDPAPGGSSIARTETRVQTTDSKSRERFRRYWAFLSPGMELIRIVLLQQIKAEAEAKTRQHLPESSERRA